MDRPAQNWINRIVASVLFAIAWTAAPPSVAGEAEWIWAEGTDHGQIPVGQVCYFRKHVNVRVEAEGKVEIVADDQYELFVNGHRVGSGQSSRHVDEYDISPQLTLGRNIVAVRAKNTNGNTAAIAARVSVRPLSGGQWYAFSSDASWRATTAAEDTWETLLFNDQSWPPASSFGRLGETAPWDREDHVNVKESTELAERFQIQKGFTVQRVFNHEQVGSVIALAFNEFGHVIVSQENGPLLLLFDRDGDGIADSTRVYCDQVQSVQGILPLNGEVFVTGSGPAGLGLYRLTDKDRNGTLETVQKIVDFKGQAGEHGPHGLTLGPDGMIYVVVGNYSQVAGKVGPGQTLVDSYEGDLVDRYEYPGGPDRGVKAPGGTVIRTTTDGKVVERVAGGLCNAYDLVFHPDGGLFVHDSDIESEADTVWYRPTGVYEITEAGEYGWRSGWAKWPEYYPDRLPLTLDTGRGSPSGGVVYEHFRFPVRYHNAMFLADWSEGRILAVRTKPRGAGYVLDSEVFVQGQPLNITDIDVAPDGSMYFCTGGRNTAGGVYRIAWNGTTPEKMTNLGSGIARAVRQPQLGSAWGRQEVAAVKKELGEQWAELVAGVAYSNDNPSHYRTRALDLMQLFGPIPSEDLLIELASVPAEAVRAKAATLMGLHPAPRSRQQLEKLLSDSDTRVRRAACEAILRSGQWPESTEVLVSLLADHDRTVAFLARRVLERMPLSSWQQQVLASEDIRVRILGNLAMVNADQSEETAKLVLAQCSELMTGFLSDADFVDTLRVCQVALHRTALPAESLAALGEQIAEEFPAGDTRVNHELIRLAAYLDAGSLADRALAFLDSDAPVADRTLVAMYLRFLSHQWSAAQRFELLRYYENAAKESDSGALALYLMSVTRDFADSFTTDDALAILEQGSAWPNSALAAIYRLPRPVDAQTAEILRQLDRELIASGQDREIYKRLRTGIVAALASAGDEPSFDYLRQLWRNDPERRHLIALGLAQQPDGENWDYLVRSLNVVEGEIALEICRQLKSVAVATDDPSALRQLILLGLRAEADEQSFAAIEELLVHWTGMERPESAAPTMELWQKWYSRTYPDRPAAVAPPADESKWDLDELVRYLESDAGRTGDPIAGAAVYERADCLSCHRYHNEGFAVGPDLSNLARRFTRREVLESILYPAHVISDQYMSKKLLTMDGKVFVGMVSEDERGVVSIRDSRNQVTRVAAADVDQILPNNSSIMPSGLLDDLSLTEISDLMAYLGVLPSNQLAKQPQRGSERR